MKVIDKLIKLTEEIVFSVGPPVLVAIISVKLILLGLFSSDYQDALFVPFVNWFLEQGGSPWEAIQRGELVAEFPYPPLMLYILSPFYKLAEVIGWQGVFGENLVRGLPLAIADLVMVLALVKLDQANMRRLSLVYLASPIIIYSTFIHNQLDVIPISLLLVSLCFLLRHNFAIAGLVFGLSLATKHHVIAILPFLMAYLWHRKLQAHIFTFVFMIVISAFLFFYPYIFDESFRSLVLFNQKQQLLLDTVYVVGGVDIFFPVFVALIVYLSFFSYRKVNQDLLLSFVTMLFASIIFFIKPSPGWYVWIIPFLTLLTIKANQSVEGKVMLHGLNFVYIIYFLFVHDFEYSPVKFLGANVDIPHVDNSLVAGIIFTVLQAVLCYSVFFVYRASILTNSIYKKSKPFLIGVGGDSSTGKTTCNLLVSKLLKKGLLQIEGDGDHKWERGHTSWQTYTHLNPKANHLHRQAEDLYALKNWQDVKRVEYDHSNGSFTSQYLLKPRDFVLISGLHPFYLPISRSCLDLKIYMDPDEDLRCYWKVRRDTKKRGYSIEKVMEQIEVRAADARKFIHPQRQYADLIFSFYAVDDMPEFDSHSDPKQGLIVELEASVHIEYLFDLLRVDVDWEYSEDLKYQTLKFAEEPAGVDFEVLAHEMVPSLDELVYEPEFEKGYNGLMQLIILLCISHKMRGER